ncbi:MAG TPA: hypothetical protein VE614_07455 [Streptomyces sp.]|nr:hypothetical protein [Streptomyces sp.]HZF88218.1 hypothetical protein [Streptomyces sp.]
MPGDLVEEPSQRGPGGDQPGECGAHALGEADRGEPAPHQPGLDLLGELGERERPVRDDQRQPAPLGGPAHHPWRRGEGAAESEDDGRGLHVLTTAEHHPDIGGLGDVHPAHRAVEPVGARHHLGLAGEHPLQGEHLAHRQGGRRFRAGGHGGLPCLLGD